jgi:hypothetical protein
MPSEGKPGSLGAGEKRDRFPRTEEACDSHVGHRSDQYAFIYGACISRYANAASGVTMLMAGTIGRLLLLLDLYTIVGPKACATLPMRENEQRECSKDLSNRIWIRSQQESNEPRIVFRSQSAELEPSRGPSFSLRFSSNGSFTAYGIGPSDRGSESTGTWRWASANTIYLQYADGGHRQYRLVQCNSHELIVIQESER